MQSGQVAYRALEGRRILLGVTGSIAAYKAAALCRLLKTAGAEVRVVMVNITLLAALAKKPPLPFRLP